jgi:hypothetical protein
MQQQQGQVQVQSGQHPHAMQMQEQQGNNQGHPMGHHPSMGPQPQQMGYSGPVPGVYRPGPPVNSPGSYSFASKNTNFTFMIFI